MAISAHELTRIFLVRCDASPSQGPCSAAAAKDLSFLELPRIPVSMVHSEESSGSPVVLPRPLVSPAVRIGRQTPFLSAALQSDRAWSRAVLEVTTWCIQGLSSTSSDNLLPVDAISLPFAGVRVRLCGKGQPIRLVPNGAAGERTCTTLTERGSYGWLQHGDILEFGSRVHVRLLAVHIRVSPAPKLAEGVSFVWINFTASESANTEKVLVNDANEKSRITVVPTAMWPARLHDWSVTPRFLKSKMLLEAEQLTLFAQDQEPFCIANYAAVISPNESDRQHGVETKSQDTSGVALRVASLVDIERFDREDEALSATPRKRSESSHGFSAAAGEKEIDAATPTTRSQQQPRQQIVSEAQASSTNTESDGGQAPNLSVLTGNRVSLTDGQEANDATSVASAAQYTIHDPHGYGCETTSRSTAPPPLRKAPLHRPSGGTQFSLGTFSETMDEKLNEALLNLERGGNAVGDALEQRCNQEALLLGVIEEDLSGTRVSSSWDEVRASAGQRLGEVTGEDDPSNPKGNSPRCKRLSSKRRRPRTPRSGRSGRSSGHLASRSGGDGECSQPLRDAIESKRYPQHPSRAAIRRRHDSQQLQEDSQVVFFDH